MLIRKAVQADTSQLAKLIGVLGYPVSKTDIAAHLAKLLRHPSSWVFVGEVENRIVASASCSIVPRLHQSKDLMRLTSLVVAEDFRRQGAARGLIEHITYIAYKNGCSTLEVTSGAARSEGHNFYESLGFDQYHGIRFLREISS